MNTTVKLAGVLVPVIFVIGALHFIHQALVPLVVPLLLIVAAVACWWIFGNNRRPPRIGG